MHWEPKKIIHELKVRNEFWDDLSSGAKTFEVRRDDRGFKVGDMLSLICLRKSGAIHYGREPLKFEISYILTGGQFGIEAGYVVLGLKAGGK